MELVSQKLDSAQEDQHDIFAKNVAEKLRHVNPTMRIISEKLINEVLFEAQMGSLNRFAYICIPPSHNQSSNGGSANESYVRHPNDHQLQAAQGTLRKSNESSYPLRSVNENEIGSLYESYVTHPNYHQLQAAQGTPRKFNKSSYPPTLSVNEGEIASVNESHVTSPTYHQLQAAQGTPQNSNESRYPPTQESVNEEEIANGIKQYFSNYRGS